MHRLHISGMPHFREQQKNTGYRKKISLSFLESLRSRDSYEAVKQYIQKNGKNGATAFICMSDMMAIGTTRAIQECGYTIPDDFSVTGYDGLGVLNYIHPGITTIDQNISSKGYIGMKMLYEMVQGEAVAPVLYVPYKIMERESVKNF
ncbi:MAG: substrate-binding domain-containing protein [Lachnospiraceae bacterium]